MIQLGAEQIGQTVVLNVLVKLFLQLLELLLFLLAELSHIGGAGIRSNDIVHFFFFSLVQLGVGRGIGLVFQHSSTAVQC
ncbi:hypothetical protein D3C81_1687000 [compost metagenome]